MTKLVKRILSRIKNIGRKVSFAAGTTLSVSNRYEGYNKIGKNSQFYGSIGKASYMGSDCRICAEIGRFCCIASGVVTAKGKHPTSDFASIHPAFFSPDLSRCGLSYASEQCFHETGGKIVIGNDVWIGTGAILLDGIQIGDGAIIAAGAVVTKDVAPYSIVAGVPARELRKRFSPEQCDSLLQLKWWDKPDSWLRAHSREFMDIRNLVNKED